MADSLFISPLQSQLYYIILSAAVSFFASGQAASLAGIIVEALTEWLSGNIFGATIYYTAEISQSLMSLFAYIAVLVLAISYLLSPFVRIRVVNWQKALAWFIFGTIFLTQGPVIYRQSEQMRRDLAGDLYRTVLNHTQIPGLSVSPGPGYDQKLSALPGGAISGLDVGIAYLLVADRSEILAPTDVLPREFRQTYFPTDLDSEKMKSLNPPERNEAITKGLQGCLRIVTAHVVLLFGIIEQLIYLALTIAAGLLFINMALVLPLALFEYTEPLAGSVLDSWFKLFIFTVIASVFQAIIVGVVIAAAQANHPAMVLGTSFVGIFLMMALLIRSFAAIGNSMNSMFTAASQVTSGKIHSPLELGGAAAGAAAMAAVTVATAGAGAAVTALAGGSMAQIAGSALAGSDKLFQGAAIGSMVLPDSSTLKEPATGFYEGAMSNRMLGPAGGLLLRHKGDDQQAFTAKDAAGLEKGSTNTVLGTAISQAISGAPAGGYASQEAALEAVRASLQAQGAMNARLEAHLEQRAQGIGQHVMAESQRPDHPLKVHVSVDSKDSGNGKDATAASGKTENIGKR